MENITALHYSTLYLELVCYIKTSYWVLLNNIMITFEEPNELIYILKHLTLLDVTLETLFI